MNEHPAGNRVCERYLRDGGSTGAAVLEGVVETRISGMVAEGGGDLVVEQVIADEVLDVVLLCLGVDGDAQTGCDLGELGLALGTQSALEVVFKRNGSALVQPGSEMTRSEGGREE